MIFEERAICYIGISFTIQVSVSLEWIVLKQIPNNFIYLLKDCFWFSSSDVFLWCIYLSLYVCFCSLFSGKISWKPNARSCGYFKLFKGGEENIGCSQHARSGNSFWTCGLVITLNSISLKQKFLSSFQPASSTYVNGATILPITWNQGLRVIFE